jgi:hypothetical protein
MRAFVVLLVGCAAAESGPALVVEDVTLRCDEAPLHGDSADAVPDCLLPALGIGGLLAAERLGDDILLLTRDLRLVLRSADGRERVLARGAADPRVAPDGRRAIVYTQFPEGTTELTPGTPGRIVLLDLDRGTRRVVTDHPLDSSPFLVPGSDDVLFVSGRTGVASLWLARPGRAAEQLTNVGFVVVDERFQPVPGRELRFDGRRASYTASYGGARSTWTLEVAP